MELQTKTSLSDTEMIYSVIKDCWAFMKKNLRKPPKTPEEWDTETNVNLKGILINYYQTPCEDFARDVFTAALTELERRDKHDP